MSAPVYYDLTGRVTANPVKGPLYIKRYSQLIYWILQTVKPLFLMLRSIITLCDCVNGITDSYADP